MDLYGAARDLPLSLRGRLRVATLADLAREGNTTDAVRWRAQRGGLLRVHRGMYLDGRTTPDLLDRIHAALAVCPPDAVLGFHTAAALWGFGVIATDSVHVVVPLATRYPQRRGIVAHQSVLPMETTRILGAPCLPAARCAIDLARTLSRRDALPVLDAALYAQVCDHSDLLAELKLHDGLRGVRQARELVALADPRAQCKQESQLRLIIHDAGLVGFEPQLPVFGTNGNPRYYLDLGNPHTKVAAEYDGSSHLDRARLQSDRSRHNWLETQGWHLRYFTARDLYTTPHTIPPTLAAPSSPPPATRRR